MNYVHSSTGWNAMLHILDEEREPDADWPYPHGRCGRSFVRAVVSDEPVDMRLCADCFDLDDAPEALNVVYFVRDRRGLIKIGTTRYRDRRVRQLKGELLAWLLGDVRTEHALHLAFAHHRHQGEWFRAGDDLLDFIARVREETQPEAQAS